MQFSIFAGEKICILHEQVLVMRGDETVQTGHLLLLSQKLMGYFLSFHFQNVFIWFIKLVCILLG